MSIIELMTETTILNKTAVRRLSIRKPETRLAQTNTMMALMMSRNKPKVTSVREMVRRIKMGLRKRLSNDITAATMMAVMKPKGVHQG